MANQTRKKNVRVTFTPEELKRATDCAHIHRMSLNEYVRMLIARDAADLRVRLEVTP